MKIFLAQQNYRIGDLKGNFEKITAAITQAKSQEVDLLIFSELSICGYPIKDFLESDDFINRCEDMVERIKPHTKDIGIVIGGPCRNPMPKGKDLLNTAYFIHDGKIKHLAHKTCLPTYDIFDEYRYFEPASSWDIFEFKGKKFAITICEDIWSLNDGNLYQVCPMDELMKQNPDIMINLSASPFDYDQREKRLDIITSNVEKYKIPMFYCNTVGTQTEIGFDGGSIIMDRKGKIRKEYPYFKETLEGIYLNELDKEKKEKDKVDPRLHKEKKKSPLHPATGNLPIYTREQLANLPYKPERHIHRIYHALVMGIQDYFDKLNFSKAILGSSGGIDSAVAIALAAAALGKENVHAVLMPSSYSSDHSVKDAIQLSKNIGNPYDIIAIEKIYDAFLETLEPQFKDQPFNVAEENIQARSRGNLLMALANKFGYILLNTSNKSELSVGYGTLYGDMAGGLSVLGDVYKTQVYALARFMNREEEIIPENIISKPPSAELRPDQKDSDSLPDYKVLDAILYEHIEQGLSRKDILKSQSYKEEIVDKILSLFYSGEYKRRQFCPILRVSGKAFGTGRRAPIVKKIPG